MGSCIFTLRYPCQLSEAELDITGVTGLSVQRVAGKEIDQELRFSRVLCTVRTLAGQL